MDVISEESLQPEQVNENQQYILERQEEIVNDVSTIPKRESFTADTIKMEILDINSENLITNSNATEDESMAAEALRQLGNSTIFNQCDVQSRIETTTPHALPLLTCSTCDLQFRTTADLHNHSSICKHNQHKCQICNGVFERKIDLNNHLVCHAVERPHSCRLCGTLFVHKKDLTLHMSTHGNLPNVNQCQVCGLTFNRPSSLTNHMKIHTYQPGRAIVNTNKNENSHLVNSLNKTRVSDSVVCDASTVVTATKPLPSISNIGNLSNWNLCYEPTNPMEDFNVDIALDVAQEMTIPASFVNVDKTDLIAYDPIKIELDNFSQTSENEPERSNCDNKKPHVCMYCSKRFTREKALISHLKLHSEALENFYQCEFCDQCFNDDFSLIKHVAHCGGNRNVNRQDEKNLLINDNVVVLESHQQNNLHVELNSLKLKNHKHACNICEKRFSTKQKLYRHMWIHRKKIFTCETCGNSFEKQAELDSHRLSSHQSNSAYFCTDCGKNFSSRQGLWEHARIHGPVPSLYECSECLKQFSSRQGYLIHKRTHSNERPYGCQYCWKAFRDGGTLRKHERIHTGERPHACPLCTKAFNQKVVLREHVRWLHAANRQPNEDGFFICLICESKISDKDELCAHIVKHSDEMAALAKKASKSNIQSKNVSIINKTKTNGKKVNTTSKNVKIGKVKTEVLPLINVDPSVIGMDVLPSVSAEVDDGNTDGEMLNFIQDYACENDNIDCDMCGKKFSNKRELTEHIKIHI